MAIPCNVGGADKALRIGTGVALVAVGLFMDLSTTWTIAAYALAVIALLTALIGYCPLNQLFGLDTCVRAKT